MADQFNGNQGDENKDVYYESISEKVKRGRHQRGVLTTVQVSHVADAQLAAAQAPALVVPGLAPVAQVQIVPVALLQAPQDSPAQLQAAGSPAVQAHQVNEDVDFGDDANWDFVAEDEPEHEPVPMDEKEEEEGDFEEMEDGLDEDQPMNAAEPAAQEVAPQGVAVGGAAHGVPARKKPTCLRDSELKKRILAADRMENIHARHVTSHAKRIDIRRTAPNTMRQVINTNTCFMCEEQGGEERFGRCEGHIANGIRCSNRGHPSCYATYNAGGITIQHAAEAYCQDKVLCGLHVCAACDSEGRKKDAYAGEIIGCMTCVKGYHPGCLPAGAIKETVELKSGGKVMQVEMFECSHHQGDARDTSESRHYNVCLHCASRKKEVLQNCSRCLQAFHPKCRKVETFNGDPVQPDICDHCVSHTIICRKSLVLVPKGRTWKLATIVEDSTKAGIARIRSEKGDVMEVAVSELVRMNENYLRAAPRGNTYWKRKWEETQNEKELERQKLEDHRKFKLRKGLKNGSAVVPTEDFSKNDELKNCDDCESFENAVSECRASCRRRGCTNPFIVNDDVHPSMKLKDYGKKGLGVVATAPIPEKTVLGQYIGKVQTEEWVAEDEKKIALACDNQVGRYYHKLNGIIIDAASWGNLTRFFNHSCAPNATVERVWKLINGKKEQRLVVMTLKDIKPGDEITIDYKWDEFKESCFCEADNCRSKSSS